MKKSKLLMPLVGLAAVASAVTPLTVTSCSKHKSSAKVIPFKAYVVDENGILRGFKPGFEITDNYDTMLFNDTEETTITGVAAAAFYDPLTNKTKIPSFIKYLKFENTLLSPGDPGSSILFSPTKEIREYAFYGAPFKKVTLPMGIETIRPFAFSHSDVEECNFPSYLQDIQEEAFSYTNLHSVVFHNDLKSFSGEDGFTRTSPWLKQHMEAVNYLSCVKHVGLKAFFNCKNINMHRITPVINAYEFDADGNGPFALLDEKTNEVTGSNIKVLDYSCYVENFAAAYPDYIGVVLEPQKTFGVEMDVNYTGGIIPGGNIIICNDVLSLRNETAKQRENLNMIFKSFGGPEYQQVQQWYQTMGDWRLLRESEANYALSGFDDLTKTADKPIDVASFDEPVSFEIRQFSHDVEPFFPEDTKVEIDYIDYGADHSLLPKITAEISEDSSKQYLKISFDGPIEPLLGQQFTIGLTISSPSYGISYAYGPHYFCPADERFERDISNPLVFNVISE